MLDILERQNQAATVENFRKLIELFPAITETENVFEDDQLSLAFRGEGATIKLAREHGKALYTYTQQQTKGFNPFRDL